MRSAVGLAILLAAEAAGNVACGQDCNAEGCGLDGLRLAVEGRCWPDGNYEVSGALDGEPFSLAVQLPLPPGGAVGDARVWVGASNDLGLHTIHTAGTPRVIELRVTREGATVIDQRLEPNYRTSYPNGEECGPACVHAEETVTVPMPAANQLCELLEAP